VSPVARTDPSRALLAALVVVVAALALVAVVLFLNSRESGSGDGSFGNLSVESLLDQGAGEVPLCFNDPVGGSRPICVYHRGGLEDEGWVAYDAQVDGCAFEPLSEASTELVDSCTGDTYPFSGEGLATYETIVEDGRLEIDLLSTGS
jgi:hypothetical protein